MRGHVEELLALESAGALTSEEKARVSAHLRECDACAARAEAWRSLGDGLRNLPEAKPTATLVSRTRERVERSLAEREDRAWNRAALGFLIVFGWTLTGVAWFLIELVVGELAVRLDWRSVKHPIDHRLRHVGKRNPARSAPETACWGQFVRLVLAC